MTAVTIRFPWMSRADRRRWAAARTLADLGELMALWLEGEIGSRPGYQPRYGPDEETEHLVPVLAALCRAGYVTTCSQPGLADTGWPQAPACDPKLSPRPPPIGGGLSHVRASYPHWVQQVHTGQIGN